MKPIAEVLSLFNSNFSNPAELDVGNRARVAVERLENMGSMGMAASFGFTETVPEEIFSNYDFEWLKYYGEKDLLNDDPTAVYGLTNIGIVHWEYLEEHASDFGCTPRVFEAARSFGLESGTTFALKIGDRRTVASVSHRKNVNDLFRREIYSLLFDITLDIYPDLYQAVNKRNVTMGEIDVLKLMARDHRDQEIADMLNLSIQTIRARRRQIMAKLNAKTISGVISKAKDAGYI
ncbi:MAG: autoinducer binding domain-containing protein [Pseudomonadota bacterium]